MIKPTVGRICLYYPVDDYDGDIEHCGDGSPLAAIIVHVWSDRQVNLTVFDTDGVSHPRQDVLLVQHDEDRPDGPCCGWMQYQVGQAAKAEALQAKLDEGEADLPG